MKKRYEYTFMSLLLIIMGLTTNIHSLAREYKLDDVNEISKIEQIFSDENVLRILNEAEAKRKTRVTIYLIAVITVTLLIVFYTGSGGISM